MKIKKHGVLILPILSFMLTSGLYGYSEGERLHGFVVTKSLPIEEVQCHFVQLEHEESGAQVVHIQADDPENFFSIGFRTPSASSNGVAHVLEHTVLCASEKFPAKDLFFSMRRRSMHTYMNAATGADYTYYPAASMVEEDFYNLLTVYLDATFHPLLRPISLAQEGCRLACTNPDDPSSPLEYKGVVYNEMKGALASPRRCLYEAVNKELFPQSPYGYNSGGDPAEITKLTHEELVAFHEKYYYPANCLFFFYGNIALDKHLAFLEKNLLGEMKRRAALPPMPQQPRFSEKVQITRSYPTQGDLTFFAFSWLTTALHEQDERFALIVLDNVLMETDASPLRSRLLQSGLCKQVGSSLDINMAEIPFTIFIEGCKEEDGDLMESIIMSTLQEPISEQLVENALHQLELSSSAIRAYGQPFGLTLFSRIGSQIYHGGQAERGLCVQQEIKRFRERIQAEPDYLKNLLKKHVINNTHFVRLCLKPDSEAIKNTMSEERKKLDAIQKSLTPQELEEIQKIAKELHALQESSEQDTLLPKLSLESIVKTTGEYPLLHERFGNVDLFHSEAFTNHLTYIDLFFPLPEIEKEDLWLLRLLALLLPEVGSGGRSAYETLEYIQEHTGGISAHVGLRENLQHPEPLFAYLCLSGSSLDRKNDRLSSLLKDMVLTADVTSASRIKELILMHYTNLQESVEQNALPFAMKRTLSSKSCINLIAETWFGISYVHKIKELVANIDAELDGTILKLQKLLFCLKNAHLVVACDKETFIALKEARFYGLDELAEGQQVPLSSACALPETVSQTFSIAAPVRFHAKGFHTVRYSNPESASVALASHLFNNLVLHKRIREQGGAYGGGSKYEPESGAFWFFSIRDPNGESTVQAFEEAIETVQAGKFTEEDLHEAKLQLLQRLDAPIAPKDRSIVGYAWFMQGITKELAQQFRHALFSASKEEIKQAVQLHIAPCYKESALITFSGN